MYKLYCKENYYLTEQKENGTETRVLTIMDRDLFYDRENNDIEEFWDAVDSFIELMLGWLPEYEVC